MAIRKVTDKTGKSVYEVYVGGRDSRKRRVQRMRRGIPTRKQAEKVEFELKRELAKLREEMISYTWDEWFAICIEKMKVELKPSSLVEYTGKNTHWFSKHLGDKEVKDITPHDVHAVVYDPEKTAGWYTRRSALKRMKRILNMAVEEGLITRNPALKVKVRVPQAKQAVLNKGEIETLLRKAKAHNHRFYPVWVMALLTGMRSGELYALKWSDIDLESGKIHVTRSWSNKNGMGPTKTAQNRVVPISSDLKVFLAEIKIAGLWDEDFVLPRLPEWKSGDQAKVLRNFCEVIDITSVRFHDLRATFITRLLSQGVPVAVVMAIVGHGEIKTTQAYIRLAGIDLKGATDELGFSLPTGGEARVFKIRDSL